MIKNNWIQSIDQIFQEIELYKPINVLERFHAIESSIIQEHVTLLEKYHQNINNRALKLQFNNFELFTNEQLLPRLNKIKEWLLSKSIELQATEKFQFLRLFKIDLDAFDTDALLVNSEILNLLKNDNDKISSLEIVLEGHAYNTRELNKMLRLQDRSARKAAWINRSEAINSLYEARVTSVQKMLRLRHELAQTKGFKSYKSYHFAIRSDISDAESEKLQKDIATQFQNVLESVRSKNKQLLEIDDLKPWDAELEPATADLKITDVWAVFDTIIESLCEIDKDLAQSAKSLDRSFVNIGFDLNKSASAFSSYLPIDKEVTIFANVGTLSKCINTLVHEIGHAIHTVNTKSASRWTFDIDQTDRTSFNEFVPFFFELILFDRVMEKLNVDKHLRNSLKLAKLSRFDYVLGYLSRIEIFEHCIYSDFELVNIRLDDQKFNALMDGYETHINWTGWSDFRRLKWAQERILKGPFSMGLYSKALTAALIFFDRYKENPVETMGTFKSSLKYSRALCDSDLYSKIGLEFPFSTETIKRGVRVLREFSNNAV
jgi:oligoendopeptidase F